MGMQFALIECTGIVMGNRHSNWRRLKMKAALLLAASLGFTAYSQPSNPPGIEWQVAFGGSGWDSPQCLLQTADGDFVVAGYSASDADGNKTSSNFGGYDLWLVRLDTNQHKIWDKSFGGRGDDVSSCIQQTADSGFVLG